MKFGRIIDQTGTFRYDAAKIILDYIIPFFKNEYSISYTQKFPWMLSSVSPLYDDEEDVSYNVQSLFANFLTEETINCITEQIYVHKS